VAADYAYGRTPVTGFKTIRYDRSGHIGNLTLSRPEKRNAQNPLMWRELGSLGSELLRDDTLRCLVVMGEGKSFSAGIDLVEGLAGALADAVERPVEELTVDAALEEAAGTFTWIPSLGCPSIAAVQGHAYGAGLQLALACDFRIFAKSARVGLVETRYGIMPDMGATVRLPRIVGESRARELILLGDIVDAAEALRIGLANRTVDDDELPMAAAKLADQLCAQPPLAIRGARHAIDAAWSRDPDESLRVAVEAQLRCLQSNDFIEGRQALVEGRAPQWRGC
jgi:enoyl-CoA hydratase/carnithine racemase